MDSISIAQFHIAMLNALNKNKKKHGYKHVLQKANIHRIQLKLMHKADDNDCTIDMVSKDNHWLQKKNKLHNAITFRKTMNKCKPI